MKELTHKLKEKFVGVAPQGDPHFKETTKNNKGITLIALIITIIVMMILVAVTVTFTVGENGILAQAKQSAKLAERAQLHEQIMGAMKLTNEGKIIVGDSYEAAKVLLEPQGYEVGDLNEADGTFEVTGEKGTYKYKITETEITVEETGGEGEIQSALTLNSNGDEIFIGWPETGFPSNGSKLVYKAEGKTIEIVTRYETFSEPHMILVNYSDGEGVTSSFVRASNFTSGNHTFGVNCSMPHYPTDWTDYRVESICSREQAGMGSTYVIEHDVYGVLPESEYPLFTGEWEIDTENSNANGLQYLSNVLIPATN